ncbi:CAP domain-containing protein [Yeosuana marina]|uniref:CAP domain-containing protein n=1 Tax=Yeosuana marina TaxID=1565536 RepID=UPI00141F74B1|nr:CAP domain-containing protein [Yeosuana marina]|tara:strand:- start:5347 stop:5841 length:495 start_codon:yes stop_codon:yes gene_type:complete
MKSLIKLPVLVLLAVLTFSCSTDNLDDNVAALNKTAVVPETKTIETQILELINNHRLSMGLNPLEHMDIIKSQAYSHTEYMVEINEVNHDNFFQRSNYLKANAGAKYVSENVAYGYTKAESVVNAWLKSESHKENIEGDFTNFDVSAEQNSDGDWFYTNIFIRK